MSLILVDASSLIYRAWFALPESMRSPDGDPINGVYGFLDMLAGLVGGRGPGGMVCCFDEDWRPQWRVDLLPAYKTHRLADASEPVAGPEEQIPVARDLLTAGGFACAGAEAFEAEDVIGTIVARTPGTRIEIVSGDRDLFQLVADPHVVVLYPRKGVRDLEVVDEAWIQAKYSIPGRRYFDFAVLRGDPSDGLPGVRGIGEKSAATLIREHGTLEAVLAAATAPGAPANGPLAKVAAEADYVRRAARVVRIASDAPIGRVRPALPATVPDEFSQAAKRLGVDGPAGRLLAALPGSRV